MFQNVDENNLVEQPLGYWEKNSYMIAATNDNLEGIVSNFFERISKIEGLKIKEKQELTNTEPGQATIIYDGEEYYIGFYVCDFSLPEMYLTGTYYFSNEEVHKLRNAKKALTIFMKFNKDSKKSYHLQLKLIVAAVPNFISVMDESAEKMLPHNWVTETASSKILPAPRDLYTVQAIAGDNETVWLHTHGLCRCGLTELEILGVHKNDYKNYYNLLQAFASQLLDKRKEFTELKDYAILGKASNGIIVVVTYLSWTKALNFYENLEIGGVADREKGHNSKTSVIFLYKTKSDMENVKLSLVTDYGNILGNNEMFLFSEEETERMRNLAVEKFGLLVQQAENKENHIEIKIALPLEDDPNAREHIWFELIGFEGEKFKAKLIQKPYYVKNIEEGNERYFTVNDITDWVIYTKKFTVTPSTTYLLK